MGNGPSAEVRVGLPFEDARDGLFLGVWGYNGHVSDIGQNRSIGQHSEVQEMTGLIPSTTVIPANGSTSMQMTVSVPTDAESDFISMGC